jgi:hypothetical protein
MHSEGYTRASLWSMQRKCFLISIRRFAHNMVSVTTRSIFWKHFSLDELSICTMLPIFVQSSTEIYRVLDALLLDTTNQ